MRNLDLLNAFRFSEKATDALGYAKPDSGNGAFSFQSPLTGEDMVVIASDGEGWDHVSVSLRVRCPSWAEMEWIRTRFFNDDETVMQLSVPRDKHINCHPFCLHLWRPQNKTIPMPPPEMVGLIGGSK